MDFSESKTIIMNYSCLALVLKPRLKPRRYTDGTSRVLPFPIPLYSIYDRTNIKPLYVFYCCSSRFYSNVFSVYLEGFSRNTGLKLVTSICRKPMLSMISSSYWQLLPHASTWQLAYLWEECYGGWEGQSFQNMPCTPSLEWADASSNKSVLEKDKFNGMLLSFGTFIIIYYTVHVAINIVEL